MRTRCDEADLDPDPLRQFQPGSRRRARPGEVPERDALATATRGRAAVGAHGAAEARRRARLRLPHEPREPEGRRARTQPGRGAPLLLALRSAAGRVEGGAEPRRRRGVGGVLPHPPSEAGSPPGPRRRAGRSPTAPSSSGSTRVAEARYRGRGRAAAAALGRLPHRPGRLRVLAARRAPAARPRRYQPRRRRAGAASASRPSRRQRLRPRAEEGASGLVRARSSRDCQRRSTRAPSTSRMPTSPSRWSPSTTGRWRMRRSPISRGGVDDGSVGRRRVSGSGHHVADADGVEGGAVAGEARARRAR